MSFPTPRLAKSGGYTWRVREQLRRGSSNRASAGANGHPKSVARRLQPPQPQSDVAFDDKTFRPRELVSSPIISTTPRQRAGSGTANELWMEADMSACSWASSAIVAVRWKKRRPGSQPVRHSRVPFRQDALRARMRGRSRARTPRAVVSHAAAPPITGALACSRSHAPHEPTCETGPPAFERHVGNRRNRNNNGRAVLARRVSQ